VLERSFEQPDHSFQVKIDELVLSMEQVMAKNEELQLAFDQADRKTVMLESLKEQVMAELATSQAKIDKPELSLEQMAQSNRDKIDDLESSKEQVVAELATSQATIDKLESSKDQVEGRSD